MMNTDNNIRIIKLLEKHLLVPIPVYNPKVHHYPSLHQFKTQFEIARGRHIPRPYTRMKSSALLYRFIFAGMGLLYALLGVILYYKSLTWTCGLVFGSCTAVKTLLCGFCGLSSLYFFGQGLLIKPERDAAARALRQAKSLLKRAYERKVVQYEINNFVRFGKEYRRAQSLKQSYSDVLDKILHYREEMLHLLSHISLTYADDPAKREELYNQAIQEFMDKANLIINSFKSASLQPL